MNRLLLLLTLLPLSVFAQSEVTVPAYDDAYCKTIRDLEAGKTDIDFKAFRESFIESQQFVEANSKSSEIDSLKQLMYKGMDNSDYPGIVRITKAILSIDYTDMMAHKILQQTCKAMGDTLNWRKYHDIEFGLLNSIVRNGDGKSCKTGWPVIQVEEEYFILAMLGANVQQQSLVNDGGLCDKMEVKMDNKKKKTYYFDVTMVFKGYKKMGM